jgi:hypothetical protein
MVYSITEKCSVTPVHRRALDLNLTIGLSSVGNRFRKQKKKGAE